MIIADSVKSILKKNGYSKFLYRFKNIESAYDSRTFDFLYKLTSREGESKLLKIRLKESFNIRHSLSAICQMNDSTGLFENFEAVITEGEYLFFMREWYQESATLDEKKKLMPSLFERLAVFHRANPGRPPFFSKYSDGKIFDSIADLVAWEVDYHMTFFDATALTEGIYHDVLYLKNSAPVIIHEDVHPANMISLPDGSTKLIDTEWMHSGVNLYEFEYIKLFDSYESDPWDIDRYGLECYRHYFKAFGLDKEKAENFFRAFELLKILRLNTYWIYTERKGRSECISEMVASLYQTTLF